MKNKEEFTSFDCLVLGLLSIGLVGWVYAVLLGAAKLMCFLF